MNSRQLLTRLTRGALHNVAFTDRARLLAALGFEQVRVSGSHHLFSHRDIPGLVNLQSVAGEAKPYQIRRVLRLVERYDVRLEDD